MKCMIMRTRSFKISSGQKKHMITSRIMGQRLPNSNKTNSSRLYPTKKILMSKKHIGMKGSATESRYTGSGRNYLGTVKPCQQLLGERKTKKETRKPWVFIK